MSTLLDSYLGALSRLKGEVHASSYDRRQIDILEARLSENIDRSLYGSTKENLAERYEILDVLNGIIRKLIGMSFYEYCRLNTLYTLPIVHLVQKVDDHTSTPPTISYDQRSIPDNPLGRIQQALPFIVSASEYVATLQKNVQSAKGIFSNNATIGQEQCEKELSSFVPFDCSNFPAYNHSLYRAKTQLQYLNSQVNELKSLCEICDDSDRHSRANQKKLQELIRILNLLSYDVIRVQTLLDGVDAEVQE